MKKRDCTLLLSLMIAGSAFGQKTEKMYLSGTGLGDTKNWAFYCSGGQNSNKWDSIAVPSQWEVEGFGDYTYGRWYKVPGGKPSTETGDYKTTFKVPSDWKNKQVRIVFEGVMTDATVKINGKQAGDMHQGAFYEFGYDITDKLIPGKENTLEVHVAKHSANNSVNASERKADWWTFGGIYRPVYLTAKPKYHISNIAVNPKGDGSFSADIFTSDIPDNYRLEASITPVKGKGKFKSKRFNLEKGTKHSVSTSWDNVEAWTPETPNLYYLTLDLQDNRNKTVHTHTERIGFRTFEFRRKDGFYLNGTKVVMKGINRHSFHPDGGRTTNKEISLQDGKLIKEMNMNAVRFHYPADKHFLDVCDSLGLFVLDELCGWQNGYDKNVAPKLLKELVTRDVNHPSVVIWDNGNEGGWSTSVDDMFYELDPQKRQVVHPWADYNGVDTHHYPAFQTGIARLINGYNVFLPTEFMHGMYDQGHGAGLEDFWAQYTAHPLFAGGFMWDFSDNAVRRSDKNGILDSDGSNGTDGILGPYREKEGSYYTVRDVWAPIQFDNVYITPSFNGVFSITNNYLFTSLDKCRMEYSLRKGALPVMKDNRPVAEESKNGNINNLAQQFAGREVKLPALAPGDKGKIKLDLPYNFREYDILEVTAYNPDGSSMCTWTWPIKYASEFKAEQMAKDADRYPARTQSEYIETANSVTLSANGIDVTFDKKDGMLKTVYANKKLISFGNGPVPVGMNCKFKEYSVRKADDCVYFVAKYLGGLDSIVWKMNPTGALEMDALMLNRASGGSGFDDSFIQENITNFGLSFSYPEEKVSAVRWFGKGPYRVWKNRQRGYNYGIWEKEYNNVITGESFENLQYPEFQGYHANMYWMTLLNNEGSFNVLSESDGLFFRLFTPQEPKNNITPDRIFPVFPEGDISFLYEIPGIRCFKPIHQHGPKSQPGMIRIKSGDEGIRMKLTFEF